MHETDSPFADQLSIDTPEQVAVTLPLASVGSRLLAVLVDTLLQGAAELAVLLLMVLLAVSSRAVREGPAPSSSGSKWVIAGLILVQFLFLWGYFSLFEAFWHGQTPGKRLLKVRVLQDSGRPISLFESLIRNLIRVVDALPSIYLVGLVTMLLNRRAKRLGDLAAGTIVVHESALPRGEGSAQSHRLITPSESRVAAAPVAQAGAAIPASAMARLTPADLELVEHYFMRNIELVPEVRHALAGRIAAHLGARLQWTPPGAEEHPERLLDAVHAAMRGR